MEQWHCGQDSHCPEGENKQQRHKVISLSLMRHIHWQQVKAVLAMN